VPPLLSFQVNRFTLDREVRERNLKNGVQTIDGTVTGVDIGTGDELHIVTVHDFAQQKHTLRARWLIDATAQPCALQVVGASPGSQRTEERFLVPAGEFRS
jgi:flavin-dependent dehydrogenase